MQQSYRVSDEYFEIKLKHVSRHVYCIVSAVEYPLSLCNQRLVYFIIVSNGLHITNNSV